MANGKKKGGNFEIEIAKRLSEWWIPGRTDIFWKTQNSGARATVRKTAGRDTVGQHGDICASDPVGTPLLKYLTISVKRGYNAASFQDIIDIELGAKRREWETWINEIRYSAKCSRSRFWMIIAKRDRRKTLIAAPREFFHEMGGGEIASVWFNRGRIGFQTLNWFLSGSPDDIRALVN